MGGYRLFLKAALGARSHSSGGVAGMPVVYDVIDAGMVKGSPTPMVMSHPAGLKATDALDIVSVCGQILR
jgi:hypothetical protein